MGNNLTSYIILLLMVVVVELFKGKIFLGSKSSTQVGAETHSPAVPVVVYRNAIDEHIAKKYPDAYR